MPKQNFKIRCFPKQYTKHKVMKYTKFGCKGDQHRNFNM